MRAAKRTLVMIRQAADGLDIARVLFVARHRSRMRAGRPGTAGSQDMGAPLLALLKQAYAPFVVTLAACVCSQRARRTA